MAEISTTYLGNSVKTLDASPEFQPVSQIILIVDENTTYTAGNTTGRTLTAECPWGTQAMANAMLARLNGYIYRPYDATDALLNPAMELGDAVNVGDDIFGGIYKRGINFNGLLMAEVSAPQDEELDHEYPWASPEQRQIDRNYKVVNDLIEANYSELSIQASQISASVTQVSNNVTALDNSKLNAKQTSNTMSWSLDANGFYINNSKTANSSNFKFKVDSSGASVNGTIVATAGSIGGFTIKNGYLTTNTSRTSHSGTQSGILLNASGLSMGNGSKRTFYVSNTGNLTATSGTFGSLSVSNGQTSGSYYGNLNGCGGSVSDLGGSISSDMGIGGGMTIGNLATLSSDANANAARALRDLGNYMAGSITANAFRATTVNCSNLYLGNRSLYTGGIYAAVPGTYSGTCSVVVNGQTRLGTCSVTISGAHYAAVNYQ